MITSARKYATGHGRRHVHVSSVALLLSRALGTDSHRLFEQRDSAEFIGPRGGYASKTAVEWFYLFIFFILFIFNSREVSPDFRVCFSVRNLARLRWKCYVRFKARERDNIRDSSLFGAMIFNQMRAIQREALYFPSEACFPRRVVH